MYLDPRHPPDFSFSTSCFSCSTRTSSSLSPNFSCSTVAFSPNRCCFSASICIMILLSSILSWPRPSFKACILSRASLRLASSVLTLLISSSNSALLSSARDRASPVEKGLWYHETLIYDYINNAIYVLLFPYWHTCQQVKDVLITRQTKARVFLTVSDPTLPHL